MAYITKKNLGDAPGREKALAKESTLKEFKKYLPKIDPAEKDPFKKQSEYITKKEKKKEWITKKEYPIIGKDY